MPQELPTLASILQKPLPRKTNDFLMRCCLRSVLLFSRRRILGVHGLRHLTAMDGPFILAANHTTYLEAIVLPTLLRWYRPDHPIRFMADWNFLLVPGLGSLMRKARVIPVLPKSARPRFLNVFKRVVVKGEHGYALAKTCLLRGESIGVFPEGKAHRHPERLMAGRLGTARLALESGVPILPLGIRFPRHQSGVRILHWEAMEFHFGEPMNAREILCKSGGDPVIHLHHQLMTRLAHLSQKTWHPHPRRIPHDHAHSQAVGV